MPIKADHIPKIIL